MEKMNIFEALPLCLLEIGGIKKLSANDRRKMGLAESDGIQYAFRGIDQICSSAQTAFGKYGITIYPNVLEYEQREYTRKTKYGESLWTHERVKVEYTICGSDGSSIKSIVFGIADDNSDKGYNKAMTCSFKNLLLRLLCIGDPADDSDMHALPEKISETVQSVTKIDKFQELKNIYGDRDILAYVVKKMPDKKWKAIEDIPDNIIDMLIRNSEKNLKEIDKNGTC